MCNQRQRSKVTYILCLVPQYRQAVGELLGRVTAQGKVEAAIWRLYAELHLSSSDAQDHMKVWLMYYTHVGDWLCVGSVGITEGPEGS